MEAEVLEAPTKFDIKKAVESIADPNCKKCYGRGYTAQNQNYEPIICRCFIKNIAKRKQK